MKHTHVWVNHVEVYPRYVSTNKKWWEFWKEETVRVPGEHIEYRFKECAICKKRKAIKQEAV